MFVLLLLSACSLLSDLGIVPAEEAGVSTEADPVCVEYLDRVAAVTPGNLSALVSTYGGGGSCWNDEATAQTCASVCEGELATLLDENPEEPACGGVAPPEVEWPFQDGSWDVEVLGEGEASCDGVDDETLALFSDMAAEYGLSFKQEDDEFPNFKASMMLLSMECSLEGDTFTCAGDGFDGASTAELDGRFSGKAHGTAELRIFQGDSCVAGLGLDVRAAD